MSWLRKAVAGAATGAVLLGFGLDLGYAQGGLRATPPSAETSRQIEVLSKVLDIVRSEYVDKTEDSKLLTAAIDGVLKSLDPHSSYMDAKTYSDMQATTSGQFGGLGMQVNMEDGVLKVVAPIDGTPASRAGIVAGDIISQIDDAPVKGLTLSQAVEKMRGSPGTEVHLEIVHKGEDKPVPLTLMREIIRVSAVRHHIDGDDVGYVRISQFSGRVSEDMKQAVQTVAANVPDDRLKGYIIDLRNNPGGLLDQAVRVAGAFLTSGEIVSIRGRDASEAQHFNAAPGDLIDGKPLIVLINGGSASASEIVAGALQDQKRATIIGSRTFGKATAPCGSPLRATTRRPATRCRPRASRRTSRCCRTCRRRSPTASRCAAKRTCRATSRPKATSRRARSPTSRRTPRTTRRCRPRSGCCAARSPTRRSRRTRPRRLRR
jgi:carboxyl-terminal processing protease